MRLWSDFGVLTDLGPNSYKCPHYLCLCAQQVTSPLCNPISSSLKRDSSFPEEALQELKEMRLCV